MSKKVPNWYLKDAAGNTQHTQKAYRRKENMFKRVAALGLASVLCLSALTACGQSSESSSAADSSSAAESGSEAADSTAADSTADSTDEASATTKSKEDLKIGVSWRTMQESRFVTEMEEIEKVCDEQGIELVSQCSENDIQKQVGQIENLISQDIDILIVNASEKASLNNVMTQAHEAGIFVCFYEPVEGETYIDFSGGNDYYEVGQLITKTIADTGISGDVCYLYGDSAGGTGLMLFAEGMQDSMKDCDINVVGEQYVENWDPAKAMGYAENWLAKDGENIKAILCMNDGMAGGAVQALENVGLAGKVLVCGQDCDLSACQRIVQGTQISTLIKGGADYARQYIETVISYYLGELTADDFEGTDTNSLGEEVPFMNYTPVIVTKDNIDEVVIDGGIYTHDEVYSETSES